MGEVSGLWSGRWQGCSVHAAYTATGATRSRARATGGREHKVVSNGLAQIFYQVKKMGLGGGRENLNFKALAYVLR